MHLPMPGDPLVDTDGQLLAPEGQLVPAYTMDVPLAKRLRTKIVRSLRELGTDSQTQTVVNAILVYHLVGIGRNEIAHLLNINRLDVDKVFELQAFQDTFEMLFKELISANSSSILARIQSFAGRALSNQMDLADSKPINITKIDDAGNEYTHKHYSVPPKVINDANNSILDRAGLHPDHLFAKNIQESAPDLEIVISDGDSNKSDIKINIKRG